MNIERILPGAIVLPLRQRLGPSLTLPLPQAYSRRAGVRRLTTEYDGTARRDAAYTADRRALCDPFHWRSELEAWARTWGEARVISYPTNSVTRFGPAVDRFRAAIAAGTISHDGDPDLTRHVLNARLVRGRGRADDDGHALYLLEKPGANRLIDAAVASVLAVEAMARAEPVALEPEPMVIFR